jgi:hypothetical protein
MRGAYIARFGYLWQITIPAEDDEGMDTYLGPYMTRMGARLSLWFNRSFG